MGVCWGCVTASTKAAAQFHVYIILQLLKSATMHSETNVKEVSFFYLESEEEVIKIVGSADLGCGEIIAREEGGRHLVCNYC